MAAMDMAMRRRAISGPIARWMRRRRSSVGREFEAKEKSAHQKCARGADKHVALELRTESPASDKAERRRWDRILPTEFRIVVVRAGKHEEICQRGRGRVRNL